MVFRSSGESIMAYSAEGTERAGTERAVKDERKEEEGEEEGRRKRREAGARKKEGTENPKGHQSTKPPHKGKPGNPKHHQSPKPPAQNRKSTKPQGNPKCNCEA